MARTQADGGQIRGVDLSGSSDDITGTLPVANGGTGNATNTLNSVLVGNGTGAITGVAPGSSTNVLTSNGTSWTSAAIPTLNQNTTGTASNVTGTVAVANGGTGATTLAGAAITVGSSNGTPTGLTLWVGSAAQYAAIGSKSSTTVYVVT